MEEEGGRLSALELPIAEPEEHQRLKPGRPEDARPVALELVHCSGSGLAVGLGATAAAL